MWKARSDSLANGRQLKISITDDDASVTYGAVLQAWQADADFRSFFIALLANAPFSAFRWETPPLTATTTNQPFEFVLLNSPGLDRAPEPQVFAEHFRAQPDRAAIAFANLGGDALLIVPRQERPTSAYGHLAAFLRQAPESQQHALWQLVGKTLQQRLNQRPVWLSTAGGGVAWLHVRLDDRPKYYGYGPYRQMGRA